MKRKKVVVVHYDPIKKRGFVKSDDDIRGLPFCYSQIRLVWRCLDGGIKLLSSPHIPEPEEGSEMIATVRKKWGKPTVVCLVYRGNHEAVIKEGDLPDGERVKILQLA